MQLIKVLFVLVAGAVASSEGSTGSLRSQVNSEAMTNQKFLAEVKQQLLEWLLRVGCACCTAPFFCSC